MANIPEVNVLSLAREWKTWEPQMHPALPYDWDELLRVRDFMTDFGRPWDLGGGTAFDLRVELLTRTHKDTDAVIEHEDISDFYDYGRSRGYLFSTYEGAIITSAAELAGGRHNAFLHKEDFSTSGPEDLEIIFRERDLEGNVYFYDRSLRFPARIFNDPYRRTTYGSPSPLPLQPDEVTILYKILNGARKDVHDIGRLLDWWHSDAPVRRRLQTYIEHAMGEIVVTNDPYGPHYKRLDDAISASSVLALRIPGNDRTRFAKAVEDTLEEQKPMLAAILDAAEKTNTSNTFLERVKRTGQEYGLGPMDLRKWELGKAAFLFAGGMQPDAYIHYEARRRLCKLAMDTRIWTGTKNLTAI